jgi:hypothetical protein
MEMEGRISKRLPGNGKSFASLLQTTLHPSLLPPRFLVVGWKEGGGYTFHVVDSLLSGRLHGIEERTLSGKRRDKKMPINK